MFLLVLTPFFCTSSVSQELLAHTLNNSNPLTLVLASRIGQFWKLTKLLTLLTFTATAIGKPLSLVLQTARARTSPSDVNNLEINFDKSVMTIDYDKSKLNDSQIISHLSENTSYSASIIDINYEDNNSKGVFSKMLCGLSNFFGFCSK